MVIDKTLARKKMKSALILLIVAVLLLGISSCTQTFYENAAKDKVAVVGRNLVLLTSDTPAELLVSYYKTSDGTSNNLVTKTIHTPYILDMGKAVVVYDSVDYKWRGGYCGKKHLIDGYKEINVSAILGDGGAEYLKLENRSEQVVKFAVVGVQKLVTKRDDERNVIESQPSPVLAHQCNTSIKKSSPRQRLELDCIS